MGVTDIVAGAAIQEHFTSIRTLGPRHTIVKNIQKLSNIAVKFQITVRGFINQRMLKGQEKVAVFIGDTGNKSS
jgi:hypothetical protein